MAAVVPVEKQVPVTQASDSGSSNSSRDERSTQGSHEDHIFKDPVTAQYWREVYDKAEYEGRHRFDPNYTWTAEEEKRLVRKVCTGANVYLFGFEPKEHQSSNLGQHA
jgi:hypothetical protein